MNLPKIALLADFPLCFIDKSTLACRGHYATWLVNVYQIFRKQKDWDIHWIVLSPSARAEHCLETEQQHFHIIPRARKSVGLVTTYLHDRWRIARTLKRLSPHIVHAWGTEDCYAMAAADFTGRKVLSLQGLLTRCVQLAPMGKFTRYHSIYEGRTLRQFPIITGESPYALQHLARLAPQAQLRLLEYAVDEDFFHLHRQPTPQPRFLYAGTMTKRKNVELLLRCFARPELAGIPLELAGVSADRLPPVGRNIIPLGRIGRKELRERMAQSWGLLCPSLTETGPTVVKEARVAGLPVIISIECGSKQYVHHGKSGYTMEPQDEEAMVRHVLQLSHDLEKNLIMGRRGQAECQQALSPQLMGQRLHQLYHELLETT